MHTKFLKMTRKSCLGTDEKQISPFQENRVVNRKYKNTFCMHDFKGRMHLKDESMNIWFLVYLRDQDTLTTSHFDMLDKLHKDNLLNAMSSIRSVLKRESKSWFSRSFLIQSS